MLAIEITHQASIPGVNVSPKRHMAYFFYVRTKKGAWGQQDARGGNGTTVAAVGLQGGFDI
jgi:hypothetical protein